MYYSLTFTDNLGSINTYKDWYMAPTSRPFLSPPKFDIETINIPGRNGDLDVTTSLSKYPTFGNRTGSWEFLIHPESKFTWHETYSKVLNYLHGQTKKVSLEDDSSFLYEGRFWIDDFKSGEHYSTITINYNVWPFKKSKWTTIEEWEENPLNLPEDFDMLSKFKELTCDSPDSISGDLYDTNEVYKQVFNSWTIPEEYRQMIIGYGVFSPIIIAESNSSKGLDVWFENTELGIDYRVHMNDGRNVNANILFSAYNPNNRVRIAVKGLGKLSIEYNIRSL